jgi:CHRD domain
MFKFPVPSLILVATIAVIAPVSQAQAATFIFRSDLTGPNEAPPNASPGTGTAFVTLDDMLNTMRVQVNFSGLQGSTVAAHIHSATAVAGNGNAGVATTIPAFLGFPIGVTSGSYDGTFDMTLPTSYNPSFIMANGGTSASAQTALFNGIQTGKAYLDIHTIVFPAGEIRGFLTPIPTPALLPGLIGMGVATWRKRRSVAEKATETV